MTLSKCLDTVQKTDLSRLLSVFLPFLCVPPSNQAKGLGINNPFAYYIALEYVLPYFVRSRVSKPSVVPWYSSSIEFLLMLIRKHTYNIYIHTMSSLTISRDLIILDYQSKSPLSYDFNVFIELQIGKKSIYARYLEYANHPTFHHALELTN